MKFKIYLITISVFFMMGCEEIGGQLIVTKAFNVIDSKQARVIVQVGSYRSSLDFKKNKVEATIQADRKLKIVFDVPAGINMPENGSFEIRSDQSGQPLDLLGIVKTVRTESPIRSVWERCQYTDYQTVCDQNGCQAVPVNIWGQRYTEYYFNNIEKNIQLNMSEVGSVSKKLAQFQGTSTTSQKIITRQDRCF